MRILRAFLLLALANALPSALAAQLPVPISVEARAGWAFPVGDFGSGDGLLTPTSGPRFAFTGRIDPTDQVGILAGYQQAWFGCEGCEAFDLDDEIVLSGFEAGVHLGLPVAALAADPWLRLSLLYQNLAYSGFGDRLVSEAGLGFGAAVGAAISVAERLTVSPGVGLLHVPVDFDFTALPQRGTNVTAITIDVGVAYHF